MDIPVNADVECTDGPCGRSTYVILNPTTDQLTHLVVRHQESPHAEWLVPIDQVEEATLDLIRLRCTRHDLGEMEPFIETEFVRVTVPEYVSDPYMAWPYVIPKTVTRTVEYEHIPPGELAVRRGARVEATDGHVGRVDEFLVDPSNGHITHLVLREGHLWGQKDVAIPVSEIGYTEEKTVYLKLDKHSIEQLPAIPIHRKTLFRERNPGRFG
jgi:sporulation protein YlmC with PRC-barrel domain